MPSRYKPKFAEDYMPQPSVTGPNLHGWEQGNLQNFSTATGYGFVLNQATQLDVLLHSATRVIPRRVPDNRSLDVAIRLDQQCDWMTASMPVNGTAVWYRVYSRSSGRLRAMAWCLQSDIDSVDCKLDEQQQAYTKLPFFTLGIETISTGKIHKFFRSNRPFRTLQRWLQARNYLDNIDDTIVCFMESNGTTMRLDQYDLLRQKIAQLPTEIRSL